MFDELMLIFGMVANMTTGALASAKTGVVWRRLRILVRDTQKHSALLVLPLPTCKPVQEGSVTACTCDSVLL